MASGSNSNSDFGQTRLNGETIYPSPLFANDLSYMQFLDNLLVQTDKASIHENIAFYIGAKAMMEKKIFHDFLMETKRRFIIARCNADNSDEFDL